jgi:hypothetical protein
MPSIQIDETSNVHYSSPARSIRRTSLRARRQRPKCTGHVPPMLYAERCENRVHVVLHRTLRDSELRTDVFIREPARETLRDFELPAMKSDGRRLRGRLLRRLENDRTELWRAVEAPPLHCAKSPHAAGETSI